MRTEFWNGFSGLRRLYTNLKEPVCEKYGITQMELDVLLFLANNPQFDTATDIIEQRKLTKSHVSSSVAKLIEKNYLERSLLSGNRRTIHLTIQPAAKDVIADGQKVQEHFFSIMWNGFSSKEKEHTQTTLLKIFANINDALEGGN